MSSFAKKLREGRVWETKFAERLQAKGISCEVFQDENGTQCVKVEDKDCACPDIVVYNNGQEVILRIEVKTLQKLYDGFGVTIPVTHFEDYITIQKSDKIPVRIVFYIIGLKEWYWNTLDNLNESKSSLGKAYFPGDKREHYVWRVEYLETDFSSFYSET